MARSRAAHSVALTVAAKAWIKSQPWYARQDDVDLDGPLLKQPLYLLLERHASHLLPRRDGEARHKSCAQCAGLSEIVRGVNAHVATLPPPAPAPAPAARTKRAARAPAAAPAPPPAVDPSALRRQRAVDDFQRWAAEQVRRKGPFKDGGSPEVCLPLESGALEARLRAMPPAYLSRLEAVDVTRVLLCEVGGQAVADLLDRVRQQRLELQVRDACLRSAARNKRKPRLSSVSRRVDAVNGRFTASPMPPTHRAFANAAYAAAASPAERVAKRRRDGLFDDVTKPHCDLAERINACAAPPAKKAKAPPTYWLSQSIKTKLGAIEDPGRQFAANIRATFGCGTTESLALAGRERRARARSAPG